VLERAAPMISLNAVTRSFACAISRAEMSMP
jgi:hypothetical protein